MAGGDKIVGKVGGIHATLERHSSYIRRDGCDGWAVLLGMRGQINIKHVIASTRVPCTPDGDVGLAEGATNT